MNDVAEVQQIAARPYRLEITPLSAEDGGGYYARYMEFGYGAHGDGRTPGEAADHAREGLEALLFVMIEHGDKIPEPISERDYSGKFNVRLPKSLHRSLSEEAEHEGVSLNMLIVNRLSKS